MMFLLFYDNVASERELMKIVAERPDYMWFRKKRGQMVSEKEGSNLHVAHSEE